MLALPLTAARAAAREPDPDGPADGDGAAAVRAVLAARRRLARPRQQAAGLRRAAS